MAVVNTLLESPQTYVEWRIEKYFDLSEETGYFLDSPTFSLSDAKWILRIYPNGPEERYGGHFDSMVLCLRRKDCGREHRVYYEIGVKRPNGTYFKFVTATETFNINQDMHRLTSFCQRSMLLGSKNIVAPDGVLTISCKAQLVNCVESISQILSLDGKETLSNDLLDMYVSKQYTDVNIIVKNREFYAHKNILTSRSTVFASMLEADMAEKSSGKIEITDCDADSFDAFLLFLYTGNMDVVSPTNAMSLYKIADKYDMEELKKGCAVCMAQCNLSVESFCDIVILANLYNDSELLVAATNFFIKNAKTILSTTMWETFLEANPPLGHKLFLEFVDERKTNSKTRHQC